MKKTFFHEDDFGQIEILPLSDLNFCSEQINKIQNFSKNHQCPDGFGWDDVFIRSENPTKFASLMIKKEDVKVVLEPILFEYENVYMGYSSQEELCPNTIAYGDHTAGKIFFRYDVKDIVTAIWCSEFILEICKIPKINELLVVDWTYGFVSPLSDSSKIENFLREKLNKFKEKNDKWKEPQGAKQNKQQWRQILVKYFPSFPWFRFKQ